MLASITPLGERGRRSRWTATVVAFLLGATAAGVLAGALLGLAGSLLSPAVLGWSARLAVLALAALVALALDVGPLRVPGPRRQVNERWRDEYRGWVYGVGYGAQLGLGVTTVVSSAATYVALLAALLSGSPARGMLMVGLFGLVRGAQPLMTVRVHRPDQLLDLHTWLLRWRWRAVSFCVTLTGAIAVLAAVGIVA